MFGDPGMVRGIFDESIVFGSSGFILDILVFEVCGGVFPKESFYKLFHTFHVWRDF
jgi:hypothetical protein